MGKIITLLTDFGAQDGYVAAMKGVLLDHCPRAFVVDAAHAVARHDVRGGAWALRQYWALFPEGTHHVAVVDPGVGTERAALVVEARGRRVLAPDNGLAAWVAREPGAAALLGLRAGSPVTVSER